MAVHNRYFFCGGVKVQIDGYDKERFFNIGAQRELSICEIRKDPADGTTSFWTTVKDFKKMKQISRKAEAKLRIRKKFGLPFFLYRGGKRKLLVAGVCSFFLILYACSFFIWDISFEGNRKFTDEMLLHYMETIPVACGMKKSGISCEQLETEIRNRFSEITWVSAEITGTRLIVRVKENEALLAPLERDETPCDLNAKKEGVIVRAVMRSGVCQVQAGDEVAKGQPLVSGTIPIYDDSETLINARRVRSDAEIYARATYQYEKQVPLTYVVKPKTGARRYGLSIKILGKSFYFLLPARGDNPWEIVMEQRQLKIFDDFYLPVQGAVITASEYIPYERAYSAGELSAIAERTKQEYIENLSEKGIQIVGNDDKIEKSESGYRISGTLTVIEDIAEPAPIPEVQEENKTVNEFN